MINPDLTDAAVFNPCGVSLIAYPIDTTVLGLALVIDTPEFGKLVAPVTIEKVRALGEACTRTVNYTPQQLAVLRAAMTYNEGENNE